MHSETVNSYTNHPQQWSEYQPLEILNKRNSMTPEFATNLWTQFFAANKEESGIYVKEGFLFIEPESNLTIESKASIEAIGKILKKTGIVGGVQLENCFFSSETWQHFCDHIIDQGGLTHLILKNGMSLSNEGLDSLAGLSTPLLSLKLESQDFNQDGGNAFARLLRTQSSLQELAIRIERGWHSEAISNAMSRLPEALALRQLWIGGEFNDLCMIHLTELMRRSENLVDLSLHKVRVSDEGWTAFAYALKDSILKDLTLTECAGIDDQYAERFIANSHHLIKVAFEKNRGVQTLDALGVALKKQKFVEVAYIDSRIKDIAIEEFASEVRGTIPVDRKMRVTLVSNSNISVQGVQELQGAFLGTEVRVYSDLEEKELMSSLRQRVEEETPISQGLVNDIYNVQDKGEREILFSKLLSRQFKILPIKKDGNCLFASLALHYLNDVGRAKEVREGIVAYIRSNREIYEPFLSESDRGFEAYCRSMELGGTWGGQTEIVAFSNFLMNEQGGSGHIAIYDINMPPQAVGGILVTPGLLQTGLDDGRETFFLYREDGSHYNVLIPKP